MIRFGCFLLLGVFGCSSSSERTAGGPIRVTATTGMIADMVRTIGGDRVEVLCLMGPGVDPHRYKPTPRDHDALRNAKLIFHNGLHLEGKMTDVMEKLGKRAVAVSQGIDPAKLRPAEEDSGGTYDPHIWFDVALWKETIPVVLQALVEVDPENSAAFRSRAENYAKTLDTLDAEIRAALAKIPKEKRVLVTCHDAFGYFGRAYDLEVHGLQGVSTASETGTKNVADLAKLLGTRQIPVVFGESTVPDAGIRAVLEAAAAAPYKAKVRLSERLLYSDALGAPDTPAGTYVGMVRENVTAIVTALGQTP